MHQSVLDKRSVFFAYSGECLHFRSVDGRQVLCDRVHELQSTQEEADTRMFLHAHHATSKDFGLLFLGHVVVVILVNLQKLHTDLVLYNLFQ